MRRKYSKPELVKIEIKIEDIIQASGDRRFSKSSKAISVGKISFNPSWDDGLFD